MKKIKLRIAESHLRLRRSKNPAPKKGSAKEEIITINQKISSGKPHASITAGRRAASPT